MYVWAILYEGFGNFPQQDQYGNNIVDEDFTICDFQPSGPHYISTNESSVQLDGKLKGYEILTEYYCDAGSIEFYRMRMQYMEQLSYLPFRAYQQIKERSSADQRDYLREFNTPALLKRAKVTAKKAYFYASQDESARRKAFVVKGDELIIDTIEEEWVKAAYEGKTTTLGWLKRSDLDIL